MSSDPMVKQRITDRLEELGGIVTADDYPELFDKLGLTDLSASKCKDAIGSLAHNSSNKRRIVVHRGDDPWEGRTSHLMGGRSITLKLVK